VLLCQPVGHEYMCSRRAFGVLERQLSARGFDVFRFDYFGTGDSGGPSGAGSLLPEWIESVSLAADELRRISGCEQIALVGLRFGAALAASAAARRTDVTSLLLWSPTVSGKSFIRQSRMLAVASTSQPDGLMGEVDGLESVGFFLNPATVSDIMRSNMRDEAYTAESVMLLTRDDSASEPELITALDSAGVKLEERRYPGHAEFMTTPLYSLLPYDALTTIAQWLDDSSRAVPDGGRRESTAVMQRSSSVVLNDVVIETGIVFARRRLAGVLVEPSTPSDNPAVILLNTGADHHVGPHRFYVPLARSWAELGFPVLRFDLAGLGDSEFNDAVPVSDSYPSSALGDVQEAISFMHHERGYSRIILAGLCSGGFHAIHASDASLTAIIAVNPPLYHHAGDPILPDPHYNNHTEARRVAKSLLQAGKWRRLIQGDVDVATALGVVVRRCVTATRELGSAIKRWTRGEQSDGQAAAKLFLDGLPIHLVFNQGDKAQVFFDREIAPRLRRRRHATSVTLDTVTGADHTFMQLRWQRALADVMTKQLLQYRSMQFYAADTPTGAEVAGSHS
jgi:alpha-beta hydrolase superfamily lysophospholipase